MQTNTATFMTVEQLAERWAVRPEKVRQLILAGELEAVDVAVSRGKPRYRISYEAVLAFERRRSVGRPAAPAPTRRRRPTRKVREYV